MNDDEDWKRREKVWANVLSEEIQARKAAEAALRAIEDRELALVHPQVQMLGDELNRAHTALDTLRVPRGVNVEGVDNMILRSLSLEDRILYLASMIVQWPKA